MINEMVEPFKLPALERMAKIVGDFFTGHEITELFKKSGYSEICHDGGTKWRFLYSTFEELQKRKFGSYIILKFLETVCDPQEYFGRPESHKTIVSMINDVLSFYSLKVNEKGKIIKIKEKRDTVSTIETKAKPKPEAKPALKAILRAWISSSTNRESPPPSDISKKSVQWSNRRISLIVIPILTTTAIIVPILIAYGIIGLPDTSEESLEEIKKSIEQDRMVQLESAHSDFELDLEYHILSPKIGEGFSGTQYDMYVVNTGKYDTSVTTYWNVERACDENNQVFNVASSDLKKTEKIRRDLRGNYLLDIPDIFSTIDKATSFELRITSTGFPYVPSDSIEGLEQVKRTFVQFDYNSETGSWTPQFTQMSIDCNAEPSDNFQLVLDTMNKDHFHRVK